MYKYAVQNLHRKQVHVNSVPRHYKPSEILTAIGDGTVRLRATSIWDSFIMFLHFFPTYQNKRIVSCILINRRAPTFHCVLINFSFSMFVKAEIRQKLNNVPKTKGH